MPHHQVSAVSSFSSTRRRVLAFSVLGLLLLVVILGLLKPQGLGHAAATAGNALAGPDRRVNPSELGWRQAPVLFVAGLAAGLLAGMIGMGGGVLKIAFMLIFLRFDFYFARAIALVTMFFSSASALWGFLKARLLVWPVASRMLVVALPASFVAVLIGNRIHPTTLMMIFGMFVIFLAFNTLAFILGDPDERVMTYERDQPLTEQEGYQAGLLGGLHGAMCGLLGISGGVIATPMQQLLLRMPLRNAIANTLLVSTAVTLMAGSVVLWTGITEQHFAVSDVVFVDLCMGTGATVGAPIGNRLSERCSITGLRLLFVALTTSAGLSILL